MFYMYLIVFVPSNPAVQTFSLQTLCTWGSTNSATKPLAIVFVPKCTNEYEGVYKLAIL